MDNPNPSILFVTAHCPYARSYGTQVRVLNIGKLLTRIGKVSLVIASAFPVDEVSLDRTREEFDLKCVIRLIRRRSLNLVDRMRHEFDPAFLRTDGFEASESDRAAMLGMIAEHDVIWVHTLRTANAFHIFRWPHSVLDIDDIPSQFFSSKAQAGSGTVRRLLDYRMTFVWRRRELLLGKRFDVISVVSNEDRRYFGGGGRIRVVPNGFDSPSQVPVRSPSTLPRIGFIGTFKYPPNREGVEWFIKRVWPLVKNEVPTVHLRLVGEDGEKSFSKRGSDIDALGWVEDPGAEIASWSAMIVPVLTGGGTRVKIAEAFSRKCPVISTSLGAFGYEVVSGEDLLLADPAQDFASACVILLKNTELGLTISENAWKKFQTKWTWDSIGASVSRAVEECLIRSNPERTYGDTLAGS